MLLAGDTGTAVSLWHNPINPLDVNSDHHVTARDALLVISDLVSHGSHKVPTQSAAPMAASSLASATSTPYVDVNGDKNVTASDALLVMSRLLASPLAGSEVARFRLEAQDLSDQPIASVNVGQDFQLAAYVSDIRSPADSNPGLWSAFTNVAYASNLVSITASPHAPGVADPGIEFGDYFANSGSGLTYGDLSTPGQILGAGAESNRFTASGIGDKLLWRVTVHASAGGNVLFDASFFNDPLHDSSFLSPFPPSPLTEADIDFVDLNLPVIGAHSVSVANASAFEGDAGQTALVFTATLSSPADQTMSVKYVTQGDTATEGLDYVGTTGTLTFTLGMQSQLITVLVNGDTTTESDESFKLLLSDPSNLLIGTPTVTGTIQNDDVVRTLAVSNIFQQEGDSGNSDFVFSVNLSGVSSQQAVVTYTVDDGSATLADNDYVDGSGTLTFTPGQTSKTITVSVVGDLTNEGDETFTVKVTPQSGPVASGTVSGTGTILDDEAKQAIVRLQVADAGGTPLAPGASLAPGADFILQVYVRDINVPAQGIFEAWMDATFDTGLVQRTTPITFGPEFPNLLSAGGTATPGLIDEIGASGDGAQPNPHGAEFLFASIPFKAIGTGLAQFGVNPADLTDHDVLIYLDDDPVPDNEVSFVNTSVSIGTNVISITGVDEFEGDNGSKNYVFQVGRFLPSQSTATVVFTTVNDTALTTDNDYVAMSGTITFTGQETSKTITVVVNGDTKFENDESFFVNLSNASGATISVPSATGFIRNDDGLPTLSIADDSRNEGQILNFVVTLSAPSGLTVTVPFNTAPSSSGNIASLADYTATSGVLTFAPGVTTRTIAVQSATDLILEPSETFQVLLGTPSGASKTDGEAQGTIVDVVPLTTLAVSSVLLPEGNSGTTNFVFTVSLSNATTQAVSVSYTTADGPAASGEAPALLSNNDYQFQSGTLVFNPGETSKVVTIAIIGDAAIESSETFSVNVTRTGNGPTTNTSATGKGTILNDDGSPTITIDNVTVAPGNAQFANAVFTVTLSAAAAQPVSVSFATQDFTAHKNFDYLPLSGIVTFTPGGSLIQTITVQVLGSSVPEENETFYVNLSSATNAQIGDAQGVATIIRQGLSVSDVRVDEGNNPNVAASNKAVFTVSLSTPLDHNVTVAYHTSDDSATAAGNDYVPTSNTLTFLPGQTSKLVTVSILGDLDIEANETFFLDLANPSGSQVVIGRGKGTITNDDGLLAKIRLQVVNSGGSVVGPGDALGLNEQFTLQAYVQDLQVDDPQGIFQAFADVLYDSGLVERVPGGQVTFGDQFDSVLSTGGTAAGIFNEIGALGDAAQPVPHGAEFLFFSVPLRTKDVGLANFTADPADEPEHDVLLYLRDNPVPVNRIQFVDTSVNIGSNVISVNNIQIPEGNSGSKDFVFTVTRFLPENSTATVVYTTDDGTATVASGDYEPTTGTLTFLPGETSHPVTVAVHGDTTDEAHETFLLRLSAATNASSSQSPGVATIVNDDGAVEVSIANASGNEGQDLKFVVTLSAVSGKDVLVPFHTEASTSGLIATAGSDYLPTSGVLTFAAGVVQQTVTVHALNDVLLDPNETFQVVLDPPTNATLADLQGEGTIGDVRPSIISGFVYVDLNDNGFKDSNESGIANVIVTATLADGSFSQSTLTTANGSYSLAGLIPGTYTLTETQPGFYRDGRDTRGGLESPFNDRFENIALQEHEEESGFNFGELGVRSEFVSIFTNRRALFATAIVTGQWGPQVSTGGTVNPKTGDVWISFDGGWDGQRTIEATFDASQGSATMTLYNNAVQVVATSTPTATGAKLTFTGTSGAAYFLRISGTNSSVAISISDPVPVLLQTPSTPPPAPQNTSLRGGLFSSSGNSGQSAAPLASPSATDLLMAEDDDWLN